MIPLLYEWDEKTRLRPLIAATSCLIYESRNNEYRLELTYPVHAEGAEDLAGERIIIAKPIKGKPQNFRIVKVAPQLSGELKVDAEHVSYDMRFIPLKPRVQLNGVTVEGAFNALSSSAVVLPHGFTFVDDMGDAGKSALNIDWNVKEVPSLRDALGGVRGSILDHWSGEYEFDNKTVIFHAKRGRDRGVNLIYGKNIGDADGERDFTETATSIYPVATYDERLITLPEYYIDGDFMDLHHARRVKVVEFSDEIKSVDALRTRTQRYIKENKVGIPRLSLSITAQDLAESLNYVGTKKQEILLCDTVHVYIPKFGIDLPIRVEALRWDVLRERIHELQLGDPRRTFAETLKQEATEVRNVAEAAKMIAAEAADRTVVDDNTGQRYEWVVASKNGTPSIVLKEIKI